MSKRKHGMQIAAEHKAKRLSAEQIRAAKCQKVHARQTALKLERRSIAEERDQTWRSLSPHEQIKILKNRPGKCKKQLGRLYEILENQQGKN
jgi:hypothetical protein